MKLCYLVTTWLLSFPCAGQTGSVQGTVYTSTGRQPVRKASVTITSVTPDHSYAIAITDAAGQFRFTGIPQGVYQILANHSGFLPVAYGSSSPGRPSHLLELAKGQTRTGVTLTMAPVSTVSGKVFDPDGDGIPSVQIALFKKQWKNGNAQFVRVFNRQTDQNGRYTVPNVTAGQYWMAAMPNFVRAVPVRPVVTAGIRPPEQGFANQFYPGVERFANATSFRLAPGQDMTEVNYHLSYVPQAHLVGSLTGVPDGVTVITATLLAEIPGDVVGAIHLPISMDRHQFQLQGVPAGPYRLSVAAGGRRAIRDVQLNANENRVDMELPPGIQIRGAVTNVYDSANQPKNFQITLSPADGLPSMNFRTAPGSINFDLGEIPTGKWSVDVSGTPPGTYVKTLRFGEQDLQGKPLLLQADSKGSLEISLGSNASKVKGTVEPAAPATILAAPRGDLAQRTALYQTTQTDENGSFSFGYLAPGPYLFCALTDPELNSWQDPEFLPKIEASCKSLEVRESAEEKLQLTLIGVPPQ